MPEGISIEEALRRKRGGAAPPPPNPRGISIEEALARKAHAAGTPVETAATAAPAPSATPYSTEARPEERPAPPVEESPRQPFFAPGGGVPSNLSPSPRDFPTPFPPAAAPESAPTPTPQYFEPPQPPFMLARPDTTPFPTGYQPPRLLSPPPPLAPATARAAQEAEAGWSAPIGLAAGAGIRIAGGLGTIPFESLHAAPGAGTAVRSAIGFGLGFGADAAAQAVERAMGARKEFSGKEMMTGGLTQAVPLGEVPRMLRASKPLRALYRGAQAGAITAAGTQLGSYWERGEPAPWAQTLAGGGLGVLFGSGGEYLAPAVTARLAKWFKTERPELIPRAPLPPVGTEVAPPGWKAVPGGGLRRPDEEVGPVVEQKPPEGGEAGAVKEGEKQKGAVGEHQRVSPRPDLQTHDAEVRQGGGEQAGGGGGVRAATEKPVKERSWDELKASAQAKLDRGEFAGDEIEELRARKAAGQREPAAPPPNTQRWQDVLSPEKRAEYQYLDDRWTRLNREATKNRLIDQPENPRTWEVANEQAALKRRMRAIEKGLPDGDIYDVAALGSGATGTVAGIHAGIEDLSAVVLEQASKKGPASKLTGRYANAPGAKTPLGETGMTRDVTNRLQAMRMGTEFKTIGDIESVVQDPVTKIWTIKTKGLGKGGEGGQTIRARTFTYSTGTRPRNAPFKMVDASGKVIDPTFMEPGRQVHLDNAQGMRAEAAGGDMAMIGAANSSAQGIESLGDLPNTGVFHLIARGPNLEKVSGYLLRNLRQMKNEGRVVTHMNATVAHVEVPSKPGGDYIVVTKKTPPHKHPDGTPVTREEAAKMLEDAPVLERIPVKSVGSFIGGVPNTEAMPANWLRDKRGLIRTTEDLKPLELDARGKEVPVEGARVGGSIRSAEGLNRIATAEGEGSRIIALTAEDMAKHKANMPQWKKDVEQTRISLGDLGDVRVLKPETLKDIESDVTSTIEGRPRKGMEYVPAGYGQGIPKARTATVLPTSYGVVPPEQPAPQPATQRQPVGAPIPQRLPRPPSRIREGPLEPEIGGGEAAPEVPPAEPAVQQKIDTANTAAEAMARTEADPTRPDMLVSELLKEKKVELDPADEMVLLDRRGQLQTAKEAAGRKAMDQNLSDDARREAADDFENLDHQIQTMDEATGQGEMFKGQDESLAWHSYRKKDYEFPAMEQKLVVAKKGSPLTDAEKTDLEKKTERLATASAQVEAQKRRIGWRPGMERDQRLRDLQREEHYAKQALDDEVFKTKLQSEGAMMRALRKGEEIQGIARAAMTSTDLSAVRRQGGLFFMSHPLRSLKIFPDMIRAAASEKNYYDLMQDIRERLNAGLYKSSKLGLTDINTPKMSEMEEAYMSRMADKIPILAHSQRAYVYFLNRLRADTFDAMAATLGKNGQVTAKQADQISNFINVFTGRGHVRGDYAQVMAKMNEAFFAPRYVLSRFQTLTGQPLRYASDPRVRKLIAQEYGRSLMGYAVMYGLVGMAGKEFVELEADPRSSDFGKIKIGNTRIDPLSGLSQTLVFMTRTATGQTKTAQGNIESLSGQRRPLTMRNYTDVATDFMRSKLAPLPAAALNVRSGKKVTGEPTQILPSMQGGKFEEGELLGLIEPMTGRDIYDAMVDHGMTRGAAIGALAIFGDSVNTYSPRAKGVRKSHQERR